MKLAAGFLIAFLLFFPLFVMLASVFPVTKFHGNEWSMKVKTPSCASYQNIQVIYPAKAGDPVEIECDDMGGAK